MLRCVCPSRQASPAQSKKKKKENAHPYLHTHTFKFFDLISRVCFGFGWRTRARAGHIGWNCDTFLSPGPASSSFDRPWQTTARRLTHTRHLVAQSVDIFPSSSSFYPTSLCVVFVFGVGCIVIDGLSLPESAVTAALCVLHIDTRDRLDDSMQPSLSQRRVPVHILLEIVSSSKQPTHPPDGRGGGCYILTHTPRRWYFLYFWTDNIFLAPVSPDRKIFFIQHNKLCSFLFLFSW